ncbi:unnamed protein product [Parnassius mnemosyne]|uniref:Chaoptin n=2 Tax=Parnassius mnemosyne TaxID=213953 RepID=A0AAV1LV87_9NEOP
MTIVLRLKKKKHESSIWQIISLLLVLPPVLRAKNTLECNNFVKSDKCTCYIFEEAIFLDCQDSNIKQIKNALKWVMNVHSLSIYDLDDTEEVLGPHFLPFGICIKHIHLSRTNIRIIDDETFAPLRQCLETLSIVSSKIKYIPQKVFSGMIKLMSIELASNYIEEIPSYSFYGLPLMKINIKQNIIRHISDSAFSSLESTLSEIDLSENNLTVFPIASIAKLRHLRSLRLSWNEMSSFPSVDDYDLKALEFLDLSSNNFVLISEDCLKFCPSLSILSFHFNFINNIHYRAFHSLLYLKSIDLSHNRIKVLNTNLFQNNKELEFIDLSHNHLHHIHGLFSNMPFLTKVFLGNNNILEVPIDSFFNSTKINTIHLQKNCIYKIHSKSFSNLENLAALRLDSNYVTQVPQDIFINNYNLTILKLDNNNVIDLNNYTFGSQAILREILINNNNLKFISKYLFYNLTMAEEIYLNNNKITCIESETFVKMSRLRHLSLHDNYLVEIDDILPKPSSTLLKLRIGSNLLSSIKSLSFRYQQKLYHLSLTNNYVKFLSKNIFSNLTHLTRIELHSNEISIIDDFTFQQLRSARNLDLHNNLLRNITNYTFVGLFELEDLNLSHNKIVFIFSMAFDTLKKIRTLSLSFNPLKVLYKNLFHQGLPLSSLYLDSCEIQKIENGTFEGMNNLKYLSFKNNSLKSSDLIYVDIPGLKYLSLSYNIFDSLPVDSFSQLPLLEVLFLEHCNLEHIFEGTFSFNKHLVRLNIAQNNIGGIPFTLFESYNSISEVNISNNFLDYVPYNTFHNLTLIETLDIADNLLPKIELSGFEKLTKLKYLNLRKNEIQSLTMKKRIVLKELLLLDLSHNKLSILPSLLYESFPKIQNINISYNDIVHFDFLLSRTNNGVPLISIDISKNPAVSWPIVHDVDVNNTLLGKLYELHICKTNLSNLDDINFNFFSSLQHLYLKFNKIRRLSISPFLKLNLLENLDLSYNKISQLKNSNFRGLEKLSSLGLSNNNIESMEPFTEDLYNLKVLDLSYNKLQNILNQDLANLKELNVLYLGFNNIKYISVTAFNNLNKIIQIGLEHNKLHMIPIELFSSIETHIQDISIKDNVIICSCQKNNTWTWIQDHPKIIQKNAVTCHNDEYPKEKCDFPILTQMSIDKHKDNSVSISWFIRNRTAVKSLQILYYDDDLNSDVTYKFIDKTETSTLISDLKPSKNYIICILTLDQHPLMQISEEEISNVNNSDINFISNISRSVAATLISQSSSSECISFDTFPKQTVKLMSNKTFNLSTILNRRMGLIVGCSLGFVVFFVMVSVLLYTKIKERKRIAKSDPAWSEMNDYHSIQSKEDILQHSTTASTDNILLGTANKRKNSLEKLK